MDTTILPHFTDHSIGHLDRVAANFSRLVSRNLNSGKALNDYEVFVGLAACYLHDVALQSTRGVPKARIPRLTTDDLLRIRKEHGRVAAQWIRANVDQDKRKFGDVDLPDLGLDYSEVVTRLAPLIAPLCEFHSGSLETVPQLGIEARDDKEIRLDLLLHLLRLADALDLDGRRVRMSDLRRWLLVPDSLFHWWRHHYVASVIIESNGRLRVTMRFPGKLSKPYIDLFRDLVQHEIDRELKPAMPLLLENDIFLYLDEIQIGSEYAEDRQLPPQELKDYIDMKNLVPRRSVDSAASVGTTDRIDDRERLFAHWNVTGNPWTDIPISFHEEEFVETQALREKLVRLDSLIESPKGELRVILGERGAGKTSFLESVRSKYGSSQHVVYLDMSRSLSSIDTPQQLYTWLFGELIAQLSSRGKSIKDPSPDDFQRVIQTFHTKKPIVLIDNLDRYSEKTDMGLIRRFLQLAQGNFQTMKKKAVILISATTEWKRDLQGEDLSYIGRGSLWTLEAFSPNDVRALIDNRLRISGSGYERVFGADAYKLIERIALGNPRAVLATCEILFDRAIKDRNERIDSDLIRECFGEDLKSKVAKLALEIASARPPHKAALESLYKFHLAIEKVGLSHDNGWALVKDLLAKNRLPHESVPEALLSHFGQVAMLKSEGSEAGKEIQYWEPRVEIRAYLKAVSNRGFEPSEFLDYYRIKPVTVGGAPKSKLVVSFPEHKGDPRVNFSYSKTEENINRIEEGKLTPVGTLLKARFALEYLLVGHLLSRKCTLPDGYIFDRRDGIFEDDRGLDRRKTDSRLIYELASLIEIFQKQKSGWFESFREIKYIQKKAEDYLRDDNLGAQLSADDERALASAIHKVYAEFRRIANGGTGPVRASSQSRKRPPQGRGGRTRGRRSDRY